MKIEKNQQESHTRPILESEVIFSRHNLDVRKIFKWVCRQ